MSDRYVPYAALTATQEARMREIYAASFPEALSAPFDDLLIDRMLGFVSGAHDAPLLGLALVRDFGDAGLGSGWTFLRYFAAGTRGDGVGSRMFTGLCDLLRSEGRSVLAWDVEDPDEPGIAAAEADLDRRRIGFYERNGGVLLPVHQYRPPHEDGHAPHLRLMATDLTGAGLPPTREVVLGVLEQRYGCGADHPAVREALASIPN